MIPEFPNFKKIELSDKKEVESFTSKFPPYSDFNFTSLWAWDTNEKRMLSKLNGNLVVRFTDYITGKSFLSFLGENEISETTSKLITFSKENYRVDFLRLIPEEIANTLDKSRFTILSDMDSRDYVYSVQNLKNMHNWSGHRSCRGIKQFLRLHPDYLVKISSLKEIQKGEYEKIFGEWARSKNIENYFESNEYRAFKKFLELKDENIQFVSLYKNDQLIGFTAYEITSGDYAIAHFSKANIKHHSAIYDILNWEEAKSLDKKGVKCYNWEQDLGIENLRKSKMNYCPINFLKKYKVYLINK